MLKKLLGLEKKEASSPKKIETKSYQVSDPFWMYALTGDTSNLSNSRAYSLYRENSSIATAVDLITDAFTQIQPVIMNSDNEVISDAEILNLLKQPNGQQTYSEFADSYCHSYLISGNAYLSALGNVNTKPAELYAVKPMKVSTNIAQDDFVNTYYVSRGAGEGNYQRTRKGKIDKYFDGMLKELFHVMRFSSQTDDSKGDSPIQAAMLEAKQQISGRKHNLSVLDDGGRLSLVFTFNDGEAEPDADIHNERRDAIRDLYSGADGNKIAVLSGNEVKVQEFGTTNKDMDYLNLDKVASQAIYNRYHVPLPLVTMDAATFNNMQTAIDMFYDFAVLPTVSILFQGLQKFLFSRFKIDGDEFRLTYDPNSIPTLKMRLLDELKTRKEINIETTNELRAVIGSADIDGGDSVYIPATLIPMGESIDRPEDDMIEDINTDE